MPQGNGSPPARRRPPDFPAPGRKSITHRGRRGSLVATEEEEAAVDTMEQQGAVGVRCVKGGETGEGDGRAVGGGGGW